MGHSIIDITRYFMILTGLWQIPLSDNKFFRKCYTIYSLLWKLMLNLFTISVVIRFLQIITENAAPGNIFGSLTITILVSMMEFNVMIFLKNEIPHLFLKVTEEERKLLESTDLEIKECYINQTKYYKFIAMCQITPTTFSTIMFITANIYKEITNSFVEHEVFMYEMWFPFDRTTHGNLVILINMCVVVIGYSFYIVSRIIPQTLIIFASIQLRILQIRIRKLFSNKNDDENCVQSKIKDTVRQHQLLIRFVTSLNNSIKNITFVEFILNAISIAAALLQVITVKTIGEMAFSVFHLTLLLVQIFILAWSANEVNIQSTNIANAVYDSNWMDQSEEIKKTLYIILMRAQKPLSLTIGPFRPMNIESALMTMKGAYSYASLMIQNYT